MESANNPTKRAPVTLKIKFKSGTIDEFVQRYAGDISHGGIFIRTKTPLTVGTTLRFEFQLRDANQLMGGDGTVVWIRENDPNRPTMVSGMGVRFDRLNDGSQLVLDRVLAHKGRPSQVIASPAVSFDDSTKENTAQGHAHGRYAPTIADDLDDDKTIQRAAAPSSAHDDGDEFADVPNQSTKIRPLSDIAQQLAAHEHGAGLAEIQAQRTMPGVGLIGDSTRPLSMSDLADATPVDDPTVAMAAPVFPEHSASADSGVYALPARTVPSNNAAVAAPSALAPQKSRAGLFAGVGLGLAAAAAAAYVFIIKKPAPPADVFATTPTEPAPVVAGTPPAPTPPTPQPVAVEPAPTPTPAPTPAPPALLETTIVAAADGATITLVKPPAEVGDRIAGGSPFAVQVPPGSELSAVVSAPGFRDATVKVRAGETVTASLVALPVRARPPVKRPAAKPAAAVSPPPDAPVSAPTIDPAAATPDAPATDPATTPATPPAATPPASSPPATTTPAATPPAAQPVTPPTPPAPTTKEPEPAWVKP